MSQKLLVHPQEVHVLEPGAQGSLGEDSPVIGWGPLEKELWDSHGTLSSLGNTLW